jgi:murein DD-endopeptidase MepM/ murein hydrolase activator NlpD
LKRILVDGAVLGAVLFALAVFPWELAGRGRAAPPVRQERPEAVVSAVAAGSEPGVTVSDLELLKSRALAFPVEGADPRTLHDSFQDPRVGHEHEALDIAAPRGTRVLAVDDGTVAKIFDSRRGGLTVYQFDPTLTFCYYYAHLDGYAPGLAEGAVLRKGDLVGFVGTTGNAPPKAPHLHFTIFKLGPEKRWWQGTAVNPFPLWALRDALP